MCFTFAEETLIATITPIKPIWSPIYPPTAQLMATVEISDAWAVTAGITLIVTIGTIFLRGRKYVEDRVAAALEDESVINRIAARVKPDLIFDSTESILVDRGASRLLIDSGIKVTFGTPFQTRQLPGEIRINFNRHLAIAPLLTALNPDAVSITAKPGRHFEWIFMIEYTMGGDYGDDYKHRYRLEIL